MIAEYIRYRIPEEGRGAFVDAYERAARYLKASPHCLGYELTQCMEHPERFTLRIDWKSLEEHVQGFRQELGFKEFFQLVQPFFHNIEEMEHYALTSVVYRPSPSKKV